MTHLGIIARRIYIRVMPISPQHDPADEYG